MNTYSLEIKIQVDVDAPSLEDAQSGAEDIFGGGELEDFGMLVHSFDIKEI